MLTRFPSYYKYFKCIASKCMHSCCAAGWEIIIDKKTAEYYKNVKGTFGEKLKNNINFSNPANFILTQNGKCPFLDPDNLCEIYSNLGEHHLCQICKDHPRFCECYNNCIEYGLGMYCEEACKIILSQTSKLSTYEVASSEKKYNNCNAELFTYLYNCRAKIFEYLANTSINICSRISDVLWFANTIQQDIDFDMLDDEDIFSITPSQNSNIIPIIEYLLTLEPNDKNWHLYLKRCISIYNKNGNLLEDFENKNPQISTYLQNIANYYIYRYFLKGIFDGDIISYVKLMAVSIAVIRMLFLCKWIENKSLSLDDCIMITRKYSEEIECSNDNIQSFIWACYKNEIFSIENILGLF